MTDTTLSFTRQIAASANSIYRCWTEPALLEQWFAPKPVRVTDAVIEPFTGGRFDSTMHIPDMGAMPSQGTVLIAEPNKRFAFTNMMRATFQPNDFSAGGFAFTAEMTITATDTGCTYTVTARHVDAQSAKAHDDMGFYTGWSTAADQMATLAKTL